MDFIHKLTAAWEKTDSLLCVGLDPDLSKLPEAIASGPDPLFNFNKAIIDATHDLVCAYKPNAAFYEATGAAGIEQLKQTCDYIRATYPEIPIIIDAKRGDIGNTNNYYAEFIFNYLGADAVTISPYMGKTANESFLAYKDKGLIMLCRTSNPGADEFQDLVINDKKLYQIVAENIMHSWNDNHNCLLVVGAPNPEELAAIRTDLGDDVVFLIPGIGAQGGNIEASVKAGTNSQGTGAIINSSREIIFASNGNDFAEAARAQAQTTRDTINKYR